MSLSSASSSPAQGYLTLNMKALRCNIPEDLNHYENLKSCKVWKACSPLLCCKLTFKHSCVMSIIYSRSLHQKIFSVMQRMFMCNTLPERITVMEKMLLNLHTIHTMHRVSYNMYFDLLHAFFLL